MDFQTPEDVAAYMVNLLPHFYKQRVLEPTPGSGNIVRAISKKGFIPVVPEGNFWDMTHNEKYAGVVMNPPFTPMAKGYKYLYRCMELSDNVIALMPWLTLINGEKRTKDIFNYGLVSVTHLPRNIFKGSRVQCCILQMQLNWNLGTNFYNYERS